MEWISVKDRLPERNTNERYSQVPCLVVHRQYWERGENKGHYDTVRILVFNHEHECWDSEDGDDFECKIEDCTHWMPLPSPPINQ